MRMGVLYQRRDDNTASGGKSRRLEKHNAAPLCSLSRCVRERVGVRVKKTIGTRRLENNNAVGVSGGVGSAALR
jgi:hypothetical protein